MFDLDINTNCGICEIGFCSSVLHMLPFIQIADNDFLIAY